MQERDRSCHLVLYVGHLQSADSFQRRGQNTVAMSGRIHLKDRYGNDLIFSNGGDIWCPTYPTIVDYRQHLKDIRHLELRKDDIIVAGYPRSGEFGKHLYDDVIASEYLGSGGVENGVNVNLVRYPKRGAVDKWVRYIHVI